MGVLYFLTTYLQSVLDHSALQAGIRMLPIAVGMLLTAKPAVVLTERLGTKLVVASGLAIAAASLLLIARFGLNTGDRQIAVALVIMGAGIGLTMSPATEAIMGALPRAKAGAGSAVNDTTREVGGTLGVAIIGSVLNSGYGSHVVTALTGLGAPPAVARDAGQSVVAGVITAAHFPPALQPAATEAVRQAFMTGIHQGSLVAAGVTAVATVVALVFLPARARASHAQATAAAPVPVAVERLSRTGSRAQRS
jgi:Na+/melibiose symporter-like transporter